MSVWDYIQSLQSLDFKTFQSLIANECDVRYTFDGESFECKGDVYVERLRKGHFENSKHVDMKKVVVEQTGHFQYHIYDVSVYERLGKGRNENGPGLYELCSDGIVTFENNQIVSLKYTFVKSKIGPPDH